jgi:uncharacterized membrane protein
MLLKWHNAIVKVCDHLHIGEKHILFCKFIIQVFSDTYNTILPVKPKPLLYPKDSIILTNSRHNSKADQIGGDIILVSFLFQLLVMFSLPDEMKKNFSQREVKQIFKRNIRIFDNRMLRISMMYIFACLSNVDMNVSWGLTTKPNVIR